MADLDWSPLFISLKTGIVATIISFFLGIFMAAKVIKTGPKAKAFWDGLFTMPMVLPPTVAGFFLLLIFSRKRPLGSFLYNELNISVVQTWLGCVIAATIIALPLMYKNARAAFEQVDQNLIYAARTLGLSERKIFWNIIMPVARPGVAAGIVLTFARALGEYGATSMLAGNIAGKTGTISQRIAMVIQDGDYAIAGFWTAVICIIAFIIIVAVNFVGSGRRQNLLFKANKKLAKKGEKHSHVKSAESAETGIFANEAVTEPELTVDIDKKLANFNLRVDLWQGAECLSILGASGCGKSMTLKCIAGIEKPDRGRIVLGDKVLFDSDAGINLPPQKRKVGYLFQDYALFPNMTVYENISIAYRGNGAVEEEEINRLIERFHLSEVRNLYPRQLSGGQKQRCAMARMLASKPEVILLDEPFSALDSYLRWEIEKEISGILKDVCRPSILVSHNRDEIYRLADRAAAMVKGKMGEVNPVKELFHNPRTREAAVLTGCKNVEYAKKTGENTLFIPGWNVNLQVDRSVNFEEGYVGIRAHRFRLKLESELSDKQYNVFSLGEPEVVEEPFEVTVFFKNAGGEKFVQWKITKELWKDIDIGDGRGYVLEIADKDILLLETGDM